MSNDKRVFEGLSALADGECDELESARVLKSLRGDARLRQRWEALHTARASLRGERADLLSAGFAARVSRALDEEAHILSPPRDAGTTVIKSRDWRRPLAGLAIAASVAAMSVLGLRALQSPVLAPATVAQAGAPVTTARAVPVAARGGTRWDLQRGDLEQRLNTYLLNHMEYATMGEMQGMLPYSRLAGYDRITSQ